ncbi:hypothetical protein B0H34DRAFT_711749 [Crassisporium funariophilum]|nr:hypothetical protein B0H34DRAFT_711749 [Crassisporium funariophilum]
MSITPQLILRQRQIAIREGVNIVRNLLKENRFPNGFTNQQMFKAAVRQPPPPGFEPYKVISPPQPKFVARKLQKWEIEKLPPSIAPTHPEHPVRSVKFLKTEILPILEGLKLLKIVRQPRVVNIEGEVEEPLPTGKVTQQKKKKALSDMEFLWKAIDPATLPKPPAPTPPKVVVGTEVGVGVDFSHLNKRRRRARVEKVSNAVTRMKSYRAERENKQSTSGNVKLHV